MWQGMDSNTGKALSNVDHLRQSLADIILTPIGSRIMRRDYGSYVPLLIDQPQNAVTRMRLIAATISAISAFEPRVKVHSADVFINSAGNLCLTVTVTRRDTGTLLTIQELEVKA